MMFWTPAFAGVTIQETFYETTKNSSDSFCPKNPKGPRKVEGAKLKASTKAVEQISGLIPNLKVEVLGTVLCKGLPREEDFSALDDLSEKIREKHSQI